MRPADQPDMAEVLSRILVVDDEPRSLELLVRTLRRLGRIETFTSGEAAWAAAQLEAPHVVVTDQRMPGMKGVELLSQLAELGVPVGRILLTGYADITATIDAINAGRVHAYLHKPWSPDQVFLGVKTLLERVHLERENSRLIGILTQKNGELEGALASLRTAQRRALDSERLAAIGRMIATIVHDFRGPLTVVRSAVTELAKDGDTLPTGEIRSLAVGAQEEAERLVRMCAELLLVVRASEDRGERDELELDPWVEDVSAVVAQEAGHQGVEMQTRLACGANVPLDAERMRRALLNLLYNALEAMPEGGTLRIETQLAGAAAVLRVIDSGVGIPDAIRETLFEPFVTAGKKSGSGLGLAVVRKVIEDHAGSIEVAKAEGGGTIFELRLPVSAG